jgi:2-dehydro-3-deoxy-D-arabinonate dehydratase
VYDLASVKPDLDTFRSLARTAAVTDRSPDDVVSPHLDDAEAVSRETLAATQHLPIDVDEVWAAGVTYEISEEARREESGMPQLYVDVYDADRPEIFFKATRNRTVGPGGTIGVRGDASWNVPEPELGVVLHRGEIVGYTVGNDVSSRDIEAANALYLPQAKVYAKCCALGPCVATDVADPHALEMTMTIERDGEQVYEGTTSTSEMVRTCEELVSYLTRHNDLPELTVLLTGTSLVPPESFSLGAGDVVDIDIEGIGRLRNPVEVV